MDAFSSSSLFHIRIAIFVYIKYVKTPEKSTIKDNLSRTETAKFIETALTSGELKLSGEGINRLLPRVSRFSKTNNTDYSETKKDSMSKA